MRHMYKQPRMEIADIAPRRIICASAGSGGWAEMGNYGTDTGGGFIQEP